MIKLTWSLIEIHKATGLSVSFLRKEIRAGRLPIKRFGRRILVLDTDLSTYLNQNNGATI